MNRRQWLLASSSLCLPAWGASRVQLAKVRADPIIDARYLAAGLDNPKSLFIRVFKQNSPQGPPEGRNFNKSGVVELWAAANRSDVHVLVHSFAICANSGGLGPKWQEGDLQVPEGIYTIDLLNPTSSYHLSMRVNYPNDVDQARNRQAHNKALGGAIMIHGSCVTIGCIPLQDEPIEELYIAIARVYPQHRVPVHIFPCPLDEPGLQAISNRVDDMGQRPTTISSEDIIAFWQDLAPIYRAFEADHRIPNVRTKGGRYLLG
jgi:murein L,D-transpeptidase YafK